MNILNAFEWLIGGQGPSAGAIDVIAVKQRDGSIKCSPFHVKLNKRKKDAKLVKLRINGKDVNLQMKVGRAGEAFFVEAIDDEGTSSPNTLRPTSPMPPSGGVTILQPDSNSMGTIQSPRSALIVSNPNANNSNALTPASSRPERPRPVHDAVEFGTGFTITASPNAVDIAEVQQPGGGEEEIPNQSAPEQTSTGSPRSKSREGGGKPSTKRGATQWTWAWGDLPTKAKRPEDRADLAEVAPAKEISELPTETSLEEAPLPKIMVPNDAVGDEALALSSVAAAEDMDSTEHRREKRFSNASMDRGSLGSSSDHKKEGNNFPSRLLSLCGSRLNELIENQVPLQEEVPITEMYQILMHGIVSRQDFLNKTSEVLSNPNLVVLLNDTVIPWSVAKMMLEASDANTSPLGCTTSSSFDVDPNTDMEVLGIAHRLNSESSPTAFHDVATHTLPPWTGRRISHFLFGDTGHSPMDISARLEKSSSGNHLPNGSDDGSTSNRASSSTIEFGTGLPIDGNDDSIVSQALTGAVEFEIDGSDHSSSSSAKQNIRPSSFPRFSSNNQIFSKHINVQWEANETPDWNRNASTASLLQFLQDHGVNDQNVDGISSYLYNLPGQSGEFGNASDAPTLWTWGDDDETPSPTTRRGEVPPSPPTTESKTDASAPIIDSSQVVAAESDVSATIDKQETTPTLETSRPENVMKPLDLKQLSLLDISLDEIYPGPARGDMYSDSDSESHRSMSYDDGDRGSLDESLTSLSDGRLVAKRYLYRRSLVPTQQQLIDMQLEEGENEIIFEVEGCAPITSHLHLWPEDARIVAIDAEGVVQSVTNIKRAAKSATSNVTIRDIESNIESKTPPRAAGSNSSSSAASGGVVGWSSLLFSFGNTSSNANSTSNSSKVSSAANSDDPGLNARQLFHDIHKNGYKILYLANKSVSHSSATKTELVRMGGEQSSVKLPPGPVFLSPDSLIQSMDPSRPDLFKAAALRGTRALFPPQHNPFYAGFCSSLDDMYAFERCGFPEGRIFLLDNAGLLQSMNRNTKRTFKEILELRHLMFPLYQDMFAKWTSATLIAKAPVLAPSTNNTTPSTSSSSSSPDRLRPLSPPPAADASRPSNSASPTASSGGPPVAPATHTNATTNTNTTAAALSSASAPQPSRAVTVSTSEDAYGDFNYWRRPIPTI